MESESIESNAVNTAMVTNGEDVDDGERILSGGRPSISIPTLSPSLSQFQTPPAKPTPNSLQYIITEATRFSTEIKRLKGELAAAQEKIAEQEAELEQLRTTIRQQDINLSEAADIMTEQQRKIEGLEERQNLAGGDELMDLRELKSMAARERKGRVEMEEKFERLKSSLKSVTGEFNVFMDELKENVLGEGGESGGEDGGGETAQGKLDRLSDFVQSKFLSWAESQVNLKTELLGVKKVVESLGKVLESRGIMEPAAVQTPGTSSSQLRSQMLRRQKADEIVLNRQQQKNQNKINTPGPSVKFEATSPSSNLQTPSTTLPSVANLNVNLQHGEDVSKSSQGFFCICGQDYSTKSNLRIHVLTFTQEGKFKCDICKQRFVLYYMLRRHLKDKHKISPSSKSGGRTVGCADCGKVYSDYANLYEHRKIAHSRKGQSANSNGELPLTSGDSMGDANNVLDEDDDDDITLIEPEQPVNRVNLAAVKVEIGEGRHISFSGKMHGMNIAKRHVGFYCICGIKFISRKRLDGHVQFQNRGQPMQYADISDGSEYEYEDQEEINMNPGIEDDHDGDNQEEEQEWKDEDHNKKHSVHPSKPLECICGYISTNNKYNLSKHIKYFTTERKFSCDYCSRRFVNTSYLRYHIIRSHKHVKRDAIMRIKTGCSKCGKTFPTMEAFNMHRKTHGSGSTSRFSIKRGPPKLFRRPVFATAPRGQFASARPKFSGTTKKGKFACTHCGDLFLTHHQLFKHLKSVHNIVQTGFVIGCVDCGISFSSRREHAQHRITVHQSAIGRSKKNQMKMLNEPPPPQLQAQDRIWSTSPNSPEPEPIPFDLDMEEPASSSGPRRRSSAVAARQKMEIASASEQDHQIDTSKEYIGHYCICGSSFNEKKNLLSHIRRQTQEWNFQCNRCDKSFYYNAALRRHMLTTHKVKNIYATKRKIIGCVKCGNTFQTWFDMRQHVKFDHPETEETPSTSNSVTTFTRTRSPRKSTPANEEVSPPEPEQPPHGVDVMKAQIGHYCLCGKNCNSERALNVHIKYHARERKLPCPVCYKNFICPSYLNQHMDRSHANGNGVTLNLFRCRKCRKTFKSNAELLRHQKTIHINKRTGNEGKRRVGRPMSSFRLAMTQIPDADGIIHKPVSPQDSISGFFCSCGKKYFHSSGLHKHIRLQTHGKIFKCSLCPKSYAEHGSLKVHMRSTHKVEYENGMHACGICAAVFDTHGEIIKHRMQAHGRTR